MFMSALMSAPKMAFEKGGVRLAARVETQIATGSGFTPYKTKTTNGGDDGTVQWKRKD